GIRARLDQNIASSDAAIRYRCQPFAALPHGSLDIPRALIADEARGMAMVADKPTNMADLDVHPLLITDTLAVWDVLCSGACRHKSAEECTAHTHLVFPYRGVYVRHVGHTATVAEPNQVIFFNDEEPYRVSHPVTGGDANLSVRVNSLALLELIPAPYLRGESRTTLNRSRL